MDSLLFFSRTTFLSHRQSTLEFVAGVAGMNEFEVDKNRAHIRFYSIDPVDVEDDSPRIRNS